MMAVKIQTLTARSRPCIRCKDDVTDDPSGLCDYCKQDHKPETCDFRTKGGE